MKIISINAEVFRHMDKVEALFDTEQPDIICMQESHEGFVSILTEKAYQTALATYITKEQDGKPCAISLLIASKYPFTYKTYNYFTFDEALHSGIAKRHDEKFIFAEIQTPKGIVNVATTHFTWTADGNHPDVHQCQDMEAFKNLVQTLPPHIMCGDFNIPRYESFLYDDLSKLYEDNIPRTYKSSLDKALHRLGNNPEKQNLFTDYMVDYMFTQKPYVVTDVRLQFGVSDHAAVVATIEQK